MCSCNCSTALKEAPLSDRLCRIENHASTLRFRPREAALPGSVTYLAQVAVIVANNAAMLDVPRRTVKDQFAHRLAGRGRVEHAPDTVAGRHVGTVNTRHGADEGKAVFA